MLKLIAAIWVAFATLLPVSVAWAQDAMAKSDRELTADGVVVAARSWDISAEVSNKISRIHFITGQIVNWSLSVNPAPPFFV